MNSSKRKRHTLYFWIDVFFLLLPLFIFVAIFLYELITFTLFYQQQAGSIINDYGSSFIGSFDDFRQYVFDVFFYDPVNEDSGLINYLVSFIWYNSFSFNSGSSNTLTNIIMNFLFQLRNIIGFNTVDSFGNENLFSFIIFYFTYIISYEFLSFFIHIVLWIPRYFKNKLYDRGLME